MDYRDKIDQMKTGSLSDRIAAAIADDIQGRKGIGNELEQIDEDIMEEMLEEWASLAQKELDNG